jgi:hypothetical protein
MVYRFFKKEPASKLTGPLYNSSYDTAPQIGEDSFVRQGEAMKAYFAYVETLQRSMTEDDLPRCIGFAGNFSSKQAGRRRQYRVYGKPPQRPMTENYQEAFFTPGI